MTGVDLGDSATIFAVIQEHLAVGTDRHEMVARGRVPNVLHESGVSPDDLCHIGSDFLWGCRADSLWYTVTDLVVLVGHTGEEYDRGIVRSRHSPERPLVSYTNSVDDLRVAISQGYIGLGKA